MKIPGISQPAKTVEEIYEKRFNYWDKNGYWVREGAEEPTWYKEDKEKVWQTLKGLRPIYRILSCGSCKQIVKAPGIIQIMENNQTIRRDFECPECANPIKTDFIFMPGIRCIL